MSRDKRIEYSGAIYHVIQRGNNKEYIFNEEIDKGYFIKQIKQAQAGMNFKVFGYVLMDNHYHFIIQTLDMPLSKIMHQINNVYSKYYNYKYKHVGHVFQGRYKSIHIQDEGYIMPLLRYIHMNPVKASICNHCSEYKWSSDIFYRRNLNGFIDINLILEMISKNRSVALRKYKEFMNIKDESDYDNVKFIGEDSFGLICKASKAVEYRKRLDEILIETGILTEGFYELKRGSRKRSFTYYKLAYIKAAYDLKYTFDEIGRNINISGSAAYDLLKRLTPIIE